MYIQHYGFSRKKIIGAATAILLINLLLFVFTSPVVASQSPPVVQEVLECVEPNICIEAPVFYDVHSEINGELKHSKCDPIPVGLAYGRTTWYKENWCHQLRGVYVNG